MQWVWKKFSNCYHTWASLFCDLIRELNRYILRVITHLLTRVVLNSLFVYYSSVKSTLFCHERNTVIANRYITPDSQSFVNANFIISVVRVKIFNRILNSFLWDELLHSEDIQTTELDKRITTNKNLLACLHNQTSKSFISQQSGIQMTSIFVAMATRKEVKKGYFGPFKANNL